MQHAVSCLLAIVLSVFVVCFSFAAYGSSNGQYDNSTLQRGFWKKGMRLGFLNSRFRGWQIARPSQDTMRDCYGDNAPPQDPSIISGDFNGDNFIDYAYHIAIGRKVYILAFLSYPSSPIDQGNVFIVTQNAGDIWIVPMVLAPAGTRYYDWEARSKRTFANDAITIVYCGKGARSYVYDEGRFKRLVTGD